ncbi:MAG: hypothetical protein ACI88C_000087 [Acidimicrobiales bacterium]|jgi:hypothetical protein
MTKATMYLVSHPHHITIALCLLSVMGIALATWLWRNLESRLEN